MPQQALRASYYRNMAAHHFLHRAILEMALEGQKRRVNEIGIVEKRRRIARPSQVRVFFPGKEEFCGQIAADLETVDPDWRGATGPALLKLLDPKTANWVIRPLLQAYLVVADELAATSEAIEDETVFIRACLRRGEAYRLRGLIGADGVSTILFKQAIGLARNRGLVESPLPEDRQRFAAEVRKALRVE